MRMKMKRFLGILLSLTLMLGLMPGMSLTAYAKTYDSLTVGMVLHLGDTINTSTDYKLSTGIGNWLTANTWTLVRGNITSEPPFGNESDSGAYYLLKNSDGSVYVDFKMGQGGFEGCWPVSDTSNGIYVASLNGDSVTFAVHEASAKQTQIITASDVTATYGDTGKKIEASTTGDGGLSYAVKSGDAVTVDASGNLTIVKAGSAVITVTAAETDTYAQAIKDVNVTVNTKAMTVSAADVTATVDGQSHGVTVNVTDPATGYTVKYGTEAGSYTLDASPTQTEAGTKTVYYQVTADNYTTYTGSAKVTVSAKQAQTITAENVTANYGDTDKKVTATTDGNGEISYAVKSGDAVTVDASGNLTIVKAGSAVITVTAAETDTYAQATKDVNVTVNTKAMTVSAEDVNVTVDGQAHGITVTVTDPASGATVKYGTEAGSYTLDASPTQTEVGEKTVYYQVTADNYTTYTGSAKVTVSAKQTQTITAENVTAAYGDTGKNIEASTSGDGTLSYAVKSGDAVTVNETTGALTIVKAGSAVITVTASETATYAQATKDVTVTINKANAVAAIVTANNSTYDGTEKPLVTVTGTPTGGTMQYALGTATEATQPYTTSIPSKTDAGTYYVWYKVIGDGNHNNTDPVCVTVTVNPKELTVTAEAKEKTEGESDPVLTYTVTGLALNDKKEDVISGKLTRKTGETAGTYAIEQGTLAVSEAYAKLYTIKYTGADFKIKAKPATPIPTAEPTQKPTEAPTTAPTQKPTEVPTTAPTQKPTEVPTTAPTTTPTVTPTVEEQQKADTLALNAGFKVSQTGSKIKIKWSKIDSAVKYDVYVAYCGNKFSKKPVKSTTGNVVTITKLNGKKINLKKNFKVYVVARGEEDDLAKTIVGHIVGRKNRSYTNAKSITLTTETISVGVGKTGTIKAKTVLVSSKKKQLGDAHATEFRYASSDESIAKVNSQGVVTGVGTGTDNTATCYVYVYARNGYAKKVKVTVKK